MHSRILWKRSTSSVYRAGNGLNPKNCLLGLLCTEVQESHGSSFFSCSQLSAWGVLCWLLDSFPLLFRDFVFSIWFSNFLLVGISMYKKSSYRNSSVPSSIQLRFFCAAFFLPGSQKGLTRIIYPVSMPGPGPVNFFLQLAVC